jgi:predicted permease
MTPFQQGVLFGIALTLGIALPRLTGSRKGLRAITLANVWLGVPGIFLVVYLTRGLVVEDIGIAAFAVAFTLISVGLLTLATRQTKPDLRGSVIMTGAFVNGINLPFPLLQTLMGTYSYAATFATVNNLTQIFVARILQSRFRTGSDRTAMASFARTFPFIALAVGLIVHYTVWVSFASEAYNQAADLAVNLLLAMNFVYFGMALERSLMTPAVDYRVRSYPFLVTALFRSLIGPLIAIVAALPLAGNPQVYLQMVFEAMMPPGITNTILARIYGYDDVFSAKSTTILTPINTIEALGVFVELRAII